LSGVGTVLLLIFLPLGLAALSYTTITYAMTDHVDPGLHPEGKR
jgi:hypothetical protein